MDDLKSTIVERLKTVRSARQLSLEQAAELTGISKAMHHFNGSRAPRRADNPLSPAGVRS